MSELQMNTDAEEYIPEIVKVKNDVNDLTLEAFDPNEEISECAIQKLVQMIQASSIPRIAFHVGEALIRTAFIKSGNASVAFRVLNSLHFLLLQAQYDLMESGFLEELHLQTIQVVAKESLKEVANNTDSSKMTILFCAELVHLISQSILNIRKCGTDVAALSPCIDMCIILSAALQIQLESSKNISAPRDPKAMNHWGNLIDAFISGLNQTLPSINTLLQRSDCVPSSSSTWISTTCLREPSDLSMFKSNPGLKQVETLKVEYLAFLLDEVLFLLKFLVVVDNGLPSRWVRSTAMDLLLSAAAVSPPRTIGNDQSDFDEVVYFDRSDPELMKDFEEFLETSGQL